MSESSDPSGGGPKALFYDRFADAYDRNMRPLERWGLARLRERALAEVGPALAGPEGSGRLLEVGAGTGGNFPFYPAGARAACVEPSREMLLRAASKTERPAGSLLVRGFAEALPFADATFDAGVATLVFCSVESPPRGLSELRRVVRKGGRVVLLEHVRPEGLLGYAFDALSLLTVALMDDHFNRRTSEEARRAGLEVLKVESYLLGVVQLIVCRVG
ncbi:MAG TPA: methyltransferase domain-containing protein [Pyrinomonadaceae bacterium]|nr:methyltransferase domain-containing protein [Pyrinomonadaceae bacterium]